jgi:hypothetical protein
LNIVTIDLKIVIQRWPDCISLNRVNHSNYD